MTKTMGNKRLQPKSIYEQADLDGDGIVSDAEIDAGRKLMDMEIAEEKADSQRSMAWSALISIMVFTALLVSPTVSESRVNALSDLAGLFYISMAGIVGAHMGVAAWMNKK